MQIIVVSTLFIIGQVFGMMIMLFVPTLLYDLEEGRELHFPLTICLI